MLRTFSGFAGALVLVLLGRAAGVPAEPPHPVVETEAAAAPAVMPSLHLEGEKPAGDPGAAPSGG
jgi:hypothetical protein